MLLQCDILTSKAAGEKQGQNRESFETASRIQPEERGEAQIAQAQSAQTRSRNLQKND